MDKNLDIDVSKIALLKEKYEIKMIEHLIPTRSDL